MQKTTVAVLLTCGFTEHFPNIPNTTYKALLLLNGRPLADYVSEALCNSDVEKVFVIQCPGEELEKVLQKNDKLVFLLCDEEKPSLADSLYCSIRGLLDYYGEEKLADKYIMFVPCDIPAVKPDDFNAIIAQVSNYDVDFYATFIDRGLLRNSYPQRHFRSIYFHDLGGYFSEQGVNFVSGRLFGFDVDKDGTRQVAVFDHDRHLLLGLSEIISDFRSSRHTSFSLILFFSRLIFERLILRGGIGITARFVYKWLSHRLTVPLVEQLLYRALNVKFSLVISQSIAFSADVDKPSDLSDVQKLLHQN
jgi:CTP:molybdopterin cytidylyltransferase MocA